RSIRLPASSIPSRSTGCPALPDSLLAGLRLAGESPRYTPPPCDLRAVCALRGHFGFRELATKCTHGTRGTKNRGPGVRALHLHRYTADAGVFLQVWSARAKESSLFRSGGPPRRRVER